MSFSSSKLKVCLIFLLFFVNSCSKQKIEMRSLLPNNAAIYMEIADLEKTLEAMAASEAFQKSATEKPDFSAFDGVQIAVAVTGFQTSGEDSVLNFKPNFVAVAETRAWSWQAVSIVENQLDKFVRNNYGADARLIKSEKAGGKFYVWTAADNRAVYALATGSLIYFGTDRAAIEQASNIKSSENLLKNADLARVYSAENLVFGYVSPDGIKQIADFAGVSAAVKTTEEESGRAFIAQILPQILRSSAKEIVWTANRSTRGIEDKFNVRFNDEIAAVAKETFAASTQTTVDAMEFTPKEIVSVTRYNLKNPLIAWRGLLLTAARNADQTTAKFIVEYSDRLLEPYAIANAEKFLSAIDSEIVTARFDEAGDQSAVIATVKDTAILKTAISNEIDFKTAPQNISNAEIWSSADKKISAAFAGNKLILGETASVLKCLKAKESGQNFTKSPYLQKFSANQSIAATFAQDSESLEKIVNVLAKNKNSEQKFATFYFTETSFTTSGLERKTVSDFGFIASLLTQVGNS